MRCSTSKREYNACLSQLRYTKPAHPRKGGQRERGKKGTRRKEKGQKGKGRRRTKTTFYALFNVETRITHASASCDTPNQPTQGRVGKEKEERKEREGRKKG